MSVGKARGVTKEQVLSLIEGLPERALFDLDVQSETARAPADAGSLELGKITHTDWSFSLISEYRTFPPEKP